MEDHAARVKREYQEMQEGLKHDIRPMIVRANGYNPEKDMHKPWDHRPYPTWVQLPDGRRVIANTREEEAQLLGKKPEPAKPATVDVATLAQPKPDAPRRGRPPKVKDQPLPANLE